MRQFIQIISPPLYYPAYCFFYFNYSNVYCAHLFLIQSSCLHFLIRIFPIIPYITRMQRSDKPNLKSSRHDQNIFQSSTHQILSKLVLSSMELLRECMVLKNSMYMQVKKDNDGNECCRHNACTCDFFLARIWSVTLQTKSFSNVHLRQQEGIKSPQWLQKQSLQHVC